MADLRLNILGDGDGATSAIDKVKTGLAGLGAGLAAFTALSVKAFEEQEQADRKLASVAGASTEAFKKQAAAIQEATGTSDDMVQEMQRMLLTYGEAPAAIDGTIKAILDMSAATGQDAVQAISELTSKTTTGRKAFIDLGLEYDNTGTRGEVLANATKALGEKFAGASATESESLAGTVRKAKAQFGELQESWGGLVAEFVTKSGVVSEMAELFRNLNQAIFGTEDYSPKQKAVIALSDEIGSLKATFQDLKDQGASLDVLEPILDQISKARAKLKELNSEPVLSAGGRADLLKAGNKKDDDPNKEIEDIIKKNHAIYEAEESKLKEMARIIKEEEDQEQRALDKLQDAKEKETRIIQRESEKAAKERERALEQEKKAIEKQEEQWKQAGAAIGGALAGALSSALDQLSSGGELDATALTADILSAVVATAVSLIPGFGGFAGIAGQLTKTGVNAIGNAAGGGRRRHNGGWAGDGMARYHLGTWVGPDEEAAILQNGERVLARNEVSAMGGPRGVEAAVKGRGGGSVVNIQTFDAGSFREIFSGRGKQGLIDANRTGHGVASFFGGR